MTVMAKGSTLAEGLQIQNEDVAKALGGLPPEKLQCSNIAADALREAILEYQHKTTSER